MNADIVLHDHGSIVVLTGTSSNGTCWLLEHLDPDAPRWGVNGWVVEPRYVAAITDAAAEDGLELRF